MPRLPRCSKRFCCRKSHHSCIHCGQKFCSAHHSKHSAWGYFQIGEEDEVLVPFKEWCFLVCWICGSRIQPALTWQDFCSKFPFFLRWVKKEDRRKAWNAFLDTRPNGREQGYLLKSQWAKTFFGAEDHFELEGVVGYDKSFPPMASLDEILYPPSQTPAEKIIRDFLHPPARIKL